MTRSILLALLLVMTTPAVAAAASDVPLMVVRYNKPKVFYQRQLHNAVSRAMAIKPSVEFDIISYVPISQSKEIAAANTAAFIRDLNSMGVGRDRIRVSDQSVSDSAAQEIYLYVD